MPETLNASDAGFETSFENFLNRRRETSQDVESAVAGIIDQVRTDGDQALFDLTQKFDRFELTAGNIRITAAEIAAARDSVSAEQLAALELAADRIRAYHEKQLPADLDYTDDAGVRLGYRWTSIGAAGLYVPGGTAAYPSSVLMNALPAKVAGVERLVIVVPTPDGEVNPLVLTAIGIAGADEVYRIGGAQAVAALAFGTETIKPVDKITGPGNIYVATAKRRVFGTVGIDMIAGPSEILVVADRENDPAWIAADLLSQAEHDASAQSILITDDAAFAKEVERAVDGFLENLPRAEIARASWRDYGGVILVNDLKDAPALIDRIAPEHLELAVSEPEPLAAAIKNAGAIFLGRYTPEALGDYVGGPNHVLPTDRSARFSSGLGVTDFMKRTSILAGDADSLRAIGPAAVTLAEAEGLEAHALSVSIRLNRES